MPYLRGQYWWISYYERGRQIRRSSGTTDKQKAAIIEDEKRLETRKRGPVPRHEYDAMMEQYLSDIEGQAKYDRSEWAALALTEYFGGRDVTTITRQDLHDYHKWRDASDATVIKELHTLSAAAKYAIDVKGWQIKNPVTWTPPAPKGRLRWLTRPQARKLLKAAESKQAPYLPDVILVALFTGMRKGEILGLTWDRVDFRKKLVYLEPQHQKGRRYDSVPLNREAAAAIKRQKDKHSTHVFVFRGKPIGDVKRSFAHACELAEIEDFHFHDLRHTCAAWLVQNGVPIRTVADIMRHRSIQTTMRYAHLAPEHTRKAVEGLSL